MLLKCQISTNTNKNGFCLPTKCLEILIHPNPEDLRPFPLSIALRRCTDCKGWTEITKIYLNNGNLLPSYAVIHILMHLIFYHIQHFQFSIQVSIKNLLKIKKLFFQINRRSPLINVNQNASTKLSNIYRLQCMLWNVLIQSDCLSMRTHCNSQLDRRCKKYKHFCKRYIHKANSKQKICIVCTYPPISVFWVCPYTEKGITGLKFINKKIYKCASDKYFFCFVFKVL